MTQGVFSQGFGYKYGSMATSMMDCRPFPPWLHDAKQTFSHDNTIIKVHAPNHRATSLTAVSFS